MSDMITNELRRTMKAIVDTASDSLDVVELTVVPARPRRRPGIAMGAAAFVAVLVVGATSTLLLGGNPTSGVAGGSPTAGNEAPTVTTAASDQRTDSESALLWKGLVNQALAEAGIDLEVNSSYEDEKQVTDGGSVTAAVDDQEGRLVLVADLQAWAEGEYRSDPEWQAEIAGSTDNGETVPEGTLFVLDDRQTSATTIRTLILVSEFGVLTVKAEETPSVPLIEVTALESVTRSLGAELDGLTKSGVATSESANEAASPVVGLDNSFIEGITADSVVTREEMKHAYEAFFGCLTANGGSGQYSFNLDYSAAISYDVGFGHVSNSEEVEKVVDACAASYVGGLPALFEDHHAPSEAALQRQIESIRACVADIDPALGERAAEINQPDRIHDLADGSEHGVGIVNCVNSNGEKFTSFG